jgi:hypothetical protein
VGIFALGLHSEYRNGKFPVIHRVADEAGTMLCRIATRAEQRLALAGVPVGAQDASNDEFLASVRERDSEQIEVLRDQARDRAQRLRDQMQAQAELLRAQAELRRSQVERIRWDVRSQIGFADAANRRITVVCPKTGKRITVSAGPAGIIVSDVF